MLSLDEACARAAGGDAEALQAVVDCVARPTAVLVGSLAASRAMCGAVLAQAWRRALPRLGDCGGDPAALIAASALAALREALDDAARAVGSGDALAHAVLGDATARLAAYQPHAPDPAAAIHEAIAALAPALREAIERRYAALPGAAPDHDAGRSGLSGAAALFRARARIAGIGPVADALAERETLLPTLVEEFLGEVLAPDGRGLLTAAVARDLDGSAVVTAQLRVDLQLAALLGVPPGPPADAVAELGRPRVRTDQHGRGRGSDRHGAQRRISDRARAVADGPRRPISDRRPVAAAGTEPPRRDSDRARIATAEPPRRDSDRVRVAAAVPADTAHAGPSARDRHPAAAASRPGSDRQAPASARPGSDRRPAPVERVADHGVRSLTASHRRTSGPGTSARHRVPTAPTARMAMEDSDGRGFPWAVVGIGCIVAAIAILLAWRWLAAGPFLAASGQAIGSSSSPRSASQPEDGSAAASPSTTPTSTAEHGVAAERWTGGKGPLLSVLRGLKTFPLQPGERFRLPTLELAPSSSPVECGHRLRAWLTPVISGRYRIQVASDDQSEVWLGTGDQPGSARFVAGVRSYTSRARFSGLAEQVSPPIALEAGRSYFIEVLHRQGTQGMHLCVAWCLPDGRVEAPIPGACLRPYQGPPEEPAAIRPAFTGDRLAPGVLDWSRQR